MDASEVDQRLAALRRAGDELAFNVHLGVRVRELTVGRAVTVLPARAALANHLGGVHAIAELAPVELAAALAGTSRLLPLAARGFVPVVGGLTTRYRAPASGELVAVATCGPEVLGPATAAADEGRRPRVSVAVTVTDPGGTVVNETTVDLVFLDLAGADDGPRR